MSRTVCIITGWGEGKWQTKNFRQQLERSGYRVIDNKHTADIIVAHSAGCYWIPKDNKAQLIVLIGLPYWPHRSLTGSVIRKITDEIRYHRRDESLWWWFNKVAHNTWYIFSRINLSYRAIRDHTPDNLPDGQTNKVLLIRAKQDPFTHPNIMEVLPQAKNYKFAELPGAHDDSWIAPKAYIDLIAKEL